MKLTNEQIAAEIEAFESKYDETCYSPPIDWEDHPEWDEYKYAGSCGWLARAESAQLTPALREGERYAGSILGDDGAPSHHVILLPGEAKNITLASALAWVSEQGGWLPTFREQLLLFVNLKAELKNSWYWTADRHLQNFAWTQSFDDGCQGGHRRNRKISARCIRRVAIGAQPEPVAAQVQPRFLNIDEARLALWKAIENIVYGNKWDDKLILAELAKLNVYLASQGKS